MDRPALDRPWRRPGAVRYALARMRNAIAPPVTVREAPADIVADRDAAVPTRDGTTLRVNVFRPDGEGKHPVILCAHPYRKDDLPRRRGRRWTYPPQYRILRQPAPVTFSSLTGWEAPDPAWWVARGFAVINADLRGSGHSDGVGKLLSREEGQDVYDVVQWAGEQPWSDGNVVMLGVSYLAVSQYGAAALRQPALKAICPWEGFTDVYRDFAFPGGIRENGFIRAWATVLSRRSRLAYDLHRMQDSHPLRDDFWRSLVPELAAIEVPMLVCGSFSDQALHSRGSVRAFTHAGSTRARLYTHRGGKWNVFYSDEALAEQLSFFRSVLGGDPDATARSVRLEVREDRETIAAVREEQEWPLARTRWTPLYLAGAGTLAAQPPTHPGSIGFNTRSRAAAFSWTFAQDTELTGPMSTRLWVEAAGCDDLNLFVGVEKWCNGRFVPFEGSYGYGRDRVATGWQRVSLRALDADASQPWDPVPAAVDPQFLRAGEVVAVDIALGHSATLWRAGEQLRLVVAGRWLSPRNPFTGQFPAAYPHAPRAHATLHWGSDLVSDSPPHLLVPEIPG